MVVLVSVFLSIGSAPIEGYSLLFGLTPYYNPYKTSDSKCIVVAAIEEEFWSNLEALGVRRIEHKRLGT
jgi:crotonobetainyl-CoA:carnitine CoA-transferase CaiB-like acyl-CoA transferase